MVIIAITAVVIGRTATDGIRGAIPTPPGMSSPFEENVGVNIIAGSEKLAFFEDPEVTTELAPYDLAFPSSAPAAEKILETTGTTGTYTPFHSPMVVVVPA